MNRRYQEWLKYIFDHEVKDPQWYFGDGVPEFQASPIEISEEGSALNSSCYMFWDICPITHLKDAPDSKEMQDAVLNVLEKILAIERSACRESAFHGLSEMFYSRQETGQEIIDRFLSKTKLDEKLLAYARNAHDGNVL